MSLRTRTAIAFTALCLLSGSGWLLDEWQPETLPGLLPVVLRSGLLTAGFWGMYRGTSRADQSRLPSRTLVPILGWSVLLVALPTIAAVRAAEYVSPLTTTLVSTLVPAFVVFFVSQHTVDFGARLSPLHLLAPALAGLAGAAFLLPFHMPSTRIGQTWLGILLATAFLSAFAAIRLHRQLAGVPVFAAASIFSAPLFLLSAPLGFSQAGQASSWNASAVGMEVLRDVLLDGPITVLTVWLLPAVPAIAFSSRYVLAVAVTIVEGYVLLRPQASWTTGLGMLLLVSSGAWLFFADCREVS